MKRADQIYNNIISAMQEAEEIEGVTDANEYRYLMLHIAETAINRLRNSIEYADNEEEQKFLSIDEMTSKLVKFEADYLIEHEEYLYDMLRDGFKGFDNFSDEEIVKAYMDKFGED